MRREPKNITELAVSRGGLRKGMKAAQFVTQWGMVVEAVGHPLGSTSAQAGSEGVHAAIQEFCSWWKANERTAWRRLATFREVFPEHETPAALAEQIGAGYQKAAAVMGWVDERSREAAVAEGLSFPLDPGVET